MVGDAVEKLKITEGLGQESNPGATRVRLIMAFLKRSFSVPPAYQFSSLCEYFPCFHSFSSHSPPWEKAEAQGVFWSTGYQHLYILLSKSFACFHLLMAMVKRKAGMGFPPGRGRAGRPSLWTTKTTHSLATAAVMVKAILSQRERRADTAK